MHRILERQLKRLGIVDGPPDAKQWAALLERIDKSYVAADQDRYTVERALDLSSTEMRERFAELRAAQRQLVEASRKAGMADVATTVLHNVGNVLNSVNVSASVAARLASSKTAEGLTKSVALLQSQPQPGKFLDEDPKAKKLLPFLAAVDRKLAEERAGVVSELEALTKHLEHIKTIVSQQLAIARGEHRNESVAERVNLAELVEDAIAVVRTSLLPNQDVVFVTDFESLSVQTDRHKVFQIVMNLLTNARDAVEGRSGIVQVTTCRGPDGQAAIVVSDNGVGVAPEIAGQIFNHGFTTKQKGHGFGLHSCACAATEIGGALILASDGTGKGATFTLTIPSATSAREAVAA